MNSRTAKIAYGDTGYFSRIILDYLDGVEELRDFYAHPLNIDGIKAAITARKACSTDRQLLVDCLKKHHTGDTVSRAQQVNLNNLLKENCYTVTTAHQPNIFTGHLYFIYKILHVIKLCEELKAAIPENDFVPVYFMGSEDADLEELGHVYINGVKHEWKTSQTGAVGRMKVDKALVQIIDDIAGELTIQTHGSEIIDLMRSCFAEGVTIEKATFKLVNTLFGEYGLLQFLPDDTDYKKPFIPVAQKELKEQFSHLIVEETVNSFPKPYKIQTGGRALNLFYLKDDTRERIEKHGNVYSVLKTEIRFSKNEIVEELESFPERFSPNVILRPVFQEMLLPNIAFVGGGGELAYWLELKHVFEAVGVPFPVLLLRNSFLLAEKEYAEKAKRLGFSLTDLFTPEPELLSVLVKRYSKLKLNLDAERNEIRAFYAGLKKTVAPVDKTLEDHTGALEKMALRKIDALEKKMLRAEKKKFEAEQRQLHKLKHQLFPNGNLQERIENFMPFYAKTGRSLISELYRNSSGLAQEFCILQLD